MCGLTEENGCLYVSAANQPIRGSNPCTHRLQCAGPDRRRFFSAATRLGTQARWEWTDCTRPLRTTDVAKYSLLSGGLRERGSAEESTERILREWEPPRMSSRPRPWRGLWRGQLRLWLGAQRLFRRTVILVPSLQRKSGQAVIKQIISYVLKITWSVGWKNRRSRPRNVRRHHCWRDWPFNLIDRTLGARVIRARSTALPPGLVQSKYSHRLLCVPTLSRPSRLIPFWNTCKSLRCRWNLRDLSHPKRVPIKASTPRISLVPTRRCPPGNHSFTARVQVTPAAANARVVCAKLCHCWAAVVFIPVARCWHLQPYPRNNCNHGPRFAGSPSVEEIDKRRGRDRVSVLTACTGYLVSRWGQNNNTKAVTDGQLSLGRGGVGGGGGGVTVSCFRHWCVITVSSRRSNPFETRKTCGSGRGVLRPHPVFHCLCFLSSNAKHF